MQILAKNDNYGQFLPKEYSPIKNRNLPSPKSNAPKITIIKNKEVLA